MSSSGPAIPTPPIPTAPQQSVATPVLPAAPQTPAGPPIPALPQTPAPAPQMPSPATPPVRQPSLLEKALPYRTRSGQVFEFINNLFAFFGDSFLYAFMISWVSIVVLLMASSVFGDVLIMLLEELGAGYLGMVLPQSLAFLASPWTIVAGVGALFGYTYLEAYVTNALWASPNNEPRFFKALTHHLATLLPIVTFGLGYYWMGFSSFGLTFGATMACSLILNTIEQVFFPPVDPNASQIQGQQTPPAQPTAAPQPPTPTPTPGPAPSVPTPAPASSVPVASAPMPSPVSLPVTPPQPLATPLKTAHPVSEPPKTVLHNYKLRKRPAKKPKPTSTVRKQAKKTRRRKASY